MGSAEQHIDRLLEEARDEVERAIQEGKFPNGEAELTRSNRRLRALEDGLRWLAREVDRLESDKPAGGERD